MKHHKKPKTVRPAIAMIELIFAIVIIGIILLSAPLVLNQAIRSSTIAMQQEAIAAAGSQISLILTAQWDEMDSNSTTGFGILNVANGAVQLANGARDLNATYTTRRFNTIAAYSQATASANFGSGTEASDSDGKDDVDDFHGDTQQLMLYASETASLLQNQGEYLDTGIRMANTVMYGSDTVNYGTNPLAYNNPFLNTSNTSTNIKLISVILTTASGEEEHNKTIMLSAFSCNIGTPSIHYVPFMP
jgi:type II secretory pathway pseudopilin PulG